MRKHRLVAIGDRLTQGFVSSAVHFTDRFYPVILARKMGLGDQEFSYSEFHSRGWLPLNLWERGPEIQQLPLYGVYHNPAAWGFEVKDFDPSQHSHPIGEQAQRVDLAIEARNQTIKASVPSLVGRPTSRSLHEQRLGLPQQHKK